MYRANEGALQKLVLEAVDKAGRKRVAKLLAIRHESLYIAIKRGYKKWPSLRKVLAAAGVDGNQVLRFQELWDLEQDAGNGHRRYGLELTVDPATELEAANLLLGFGQAYVAIERLLSGMQQAEACGEWGTWIRIADRLADTARVVGNLRLSQFVTARMLDEGRKRKNPLWIATAIHNRALTKREANREDAGSWIADYCSIEQLLEGIDPDIHPLESEEWAPEWIKVRRDYITGIFTPWIFNPELAQRSEISLWTKRYVEALKEAPPQDDPGLTNVEVYARGLVMVGDLEGASEKLSFVQSVRQGGPMLEQLKVDRLRTCILSFTKAREAYDIAVSHERNCKQKGLLKYAVEFQWLSERFKLASRQPRHFSF